MDIFEELKGYKELLDSEIITQEEFDKKKSRIAIKYCSRYRQFFTKKEFGRRILK